MGRVLHVLSGLFASAALGEVEDVRLSVVGFDLNDDAIGSASCAKPFVSIPAVHPEIGPKIKWADKFRNPSLFRSMYRRLAGVRGSVVDRPVRCACGEREQE